MYMRGLGGMNNVCHRFQRASRAMPAIELGATSGPKTLKLEDPFRPFHGIVDSCLTVLCASVCFCKQCHQSVTEGTSPVEIVVAAVVLAVDYLVTFGLQRVANSVVIEDLSLEFKAPGLYVESNRQRRRADELAGRPPSLLVGI